MVAAHLIILFEFVDSREVLREAYYRVFFKICWEVLHSVYFDVGIEFLQLAEAGRRPAHLSHIFFL